MVLYGTGDPIEALSVLARHVISVHCKDGDWPAIDNPAALGKERPLGEGAVDVRAFVSKLKEIGYRGILCIEREERNAEQRANDIHRAILLLKEISGASEAASATF